MKFKVGDKVRVKKDLVGGHDYGEDNLYFGYGMEPLRGETFIVKSCSGLHFKLEGAGGWDFNEAMLEPADGIMPEKLIIYREDNKTIAKYYKDDKTVTAEAKCAPEDEFNFEYGAKLAIDRAIEKMEEEKIGYSWVKCVGYRQNQEFAFTVDKEYKIYNNGKITNDNGFVYSNSETKEEALDFLSKWYIFEEAN